MKYLFLLLGMTLLIGAGCAPLQKNAITEPDTFGQSRFGFVTTTETTKTLEGGWARPFPGPFWWDAIETTPGVFDWSVADAEVRRWNNADQAILAIVWPFAEWDQVKCHAGDKMVAHPFKEGDVLLESLCNVESYQRFLTALVERYDGDGIDDMPELTHPITHWEISHEPDVQTSDLSYYQMGPYAYAEVWRISYETIKQVDANAVVLPAGQSNMLTNGVTFFRPVLEFNRQQFVIGNMHSNEVDIEFFTDEYRAFINGLGFDDQPFWVTQAVVGLWDGPVEDDRRAQLLFEGTVQAFANGAERVFFKDLEGEKSWTTFDLIADLIDDFDEVQRINNNAVLFTVGEDSIMAIWNGIAFPGDYEDAQQVDILRYDGTRDRVKASTLIGTEPMFVFVE